MAQQHTLDALSSEADVDAVEAEGGKAELERLFDARALCEPIVNAARSHFIGGKLRNAVEDAALALVMRIKERTGIQDDDGTALMTKVFTSKSPLLRTRENSSKFDDNVQIGWMFLFAGAMRALRNPAAHSLDEPDPQDALDAISFFNLLFRQQERMSRPPDGA